MERKGIRLTKSTVTGAAPAVGRYDLWDDTLSGFGVRVAPSGVKTFILRYRPKGRGAPKRFMTLGRYGPVTAEDARRRATKILGQVADGQDPAIKSFTDNLSPTIDDACAQFLAQHVVAKRKPNTVAFYRHLIEVRISPSLGRQKLMDITKTDVAKFHHTMRSTPYLANRAVAALASLYTWAGRHGLVPEEFNPARRIEKYRESHRERYLTSEEMSRLGESLRQAETIGIPFGVDNSRLMSKHAPKPENRSTVFSPFAVAAIRLLLLTGCRLNEILGLRWSEIDFERGLLFLPDSKTGRKTVLLGAPVVRLLADLPRAGDYVIAGVDPETARTSLKRPWDAIRKHAGLKGVRLHDLRHSYASVAAGAGLGLPIIGKLLGHTQTSTTARYAHLADDPLRRASEIVSGVIASAIGSPARSSMETSADQVPGGNNIKD